MKQATYTWEAATANSRRAGRTESIAEATADGTAVTSYEYADDQQVKSAKTVAAAPVSRVGCRRRRRRHNRHGRRGERERRPRRSTVRARSTTGKDVRRVRLRCHPRGQGDHQPDLPVHEPTTRLTPTTARQRDEEQRSTARRPERASRRLSKTYDDSNRLDEREALGQRQQHLDRDRVLELRPQRRAADHGRQGRATSYGAAARDPDQSASYDAFGNLLTETDWGGRHGRQDHLRSRRSGC